MTDVPPDPTEPALTDLLEFPPLPQQPGPAGRPDGLGATGGYRVPRAAGPSPLESQGPGPSLSGGAPAVPPATPTAPTTPRRSGASSGSGSSPLRMVPEAEATARLRIMLPTTMPTPSTALRPQAAWEDTHTVDVSTTTPFAQTAASPASPSTLPSQLAAMTTATMVIPLPPSLRPSAGLLTTTLPPDQAAQANAARIGDAFRDTIEEIFGVDLDTVDPAELGLIGRRPASRAAGAPRPDAAAAADFDTAGFDGYASSTEYESPLDYAEAGYAGAGANADGGAGWHQSADELAAESFPPIPSPTRPQASGDLTPTVSFPRPVPSEMFGGAYGVPTQHAPLPVPTARPAAFGRGAGAPDPARHALALRYLGGIFHDSSGESSFLDPEQVDQGWIPSAFGAAPPDAPTERIARIPATDGPIPGMPGGGSRGTMSQNPAPPNPASQGTQTPGTPGAGSGSPGAQPGPHDRPGPQPATSSSPSTSSTLSRPRPKPAIDETAVLEAVPSSVSSPPSAGRSSRTSAGSTGTGRSGGRIVGRASHSSRADRTDRADRADSRTERLGARRKRPGASAAPDLAQDQDQDQGHAGRNRGRTLTIAGLCVAACAVLYGIALLFSGNVVSGAIPEGTVVGGVPIGGLSPDAARAKLEQDLGPASLKPVALLIGQTPATLDPAKSGLSFDVDATVAAAQAQRTSPFTIIPALFGVQHTLAPVTDVDSAALTTSLSNLAAVYDTPMIEGKITFDHARPVVTEPRQGRGFDVPTAVTALSSGYLQVSAPIELPVSTLQPLATPDALQSALNRLARPAVAAPITLDTGGVATTLTPTQIGNALAIEPDADGVMVPVFDGGRLHADLAPGALALEKPGTNAGFTLIGGKPQLVPERDGTGFAPRALASALTGVIARPAPRHATLRIGPLPPAFTTADAQALGVTSVLGSATLTVPAAPDRTADTQRAAGLVNGSVVAPGAVWSFNKTVGAPTSANGFSELEPAQAKAQGVDLSGGADLVATGVFDAAFRSGMGDTVHHPDAAYLSRYPVGLDAAVVWPGTDLQWTNTGSHPVYLYASATAGQLTVALLGQPSYDQVSVAVSDRTKIVPVTASARSGCPAQPASEGFEVTVTRVLLRGGAQVGTEQFHVTYAPYAGTVCASGSGSTTNARSGSGSPSSNPTSGTGTDNPPPTSAPPAPAPAPTSPGGALGGLLH